MMQQEAQAQPAPAFGRFFRGKNRISLSPMKFRRWSSSSSPYYIVKYRHVRKGAEDAIWCRTTIALFVVAPLLCWTALGSGLPRPCARFSQLHNNTRKRSHHQGLVGVDRRFCCRQHLVVRWSCRMEVLQSRRAHQQQLGTKK